MSLHLTVTIGDGVCKEDLIISMTKLVIKAKTIVVHSKKGMCQKGIALLSGIQVVDIVCHLRSAIRNVLTPLDPTCA